MAEHEAVQAGVLAVRPVEGLLVLCVRTLPGDRAAEQALREAGLPPMNMPGEVSGHGPWLAWQAPHARLLLGEPCAAMRSVQAALAAGRHATALAVDTSEATDVIELQGPGLDEALASWVDAGALPRIPGRASGCRFVDVPVLLMRLAEARLWLLVDRPLRPYVQSWLHPLIGRDGHERSPTQKGHPSAGGSQEAAPATQEAPATVHPAAPAWSRGSSH
jgi:sarcosine oxidase gamma subunit